MTDENTNNTDQNENTDHQSQSTEKTENTVPSYRLKEEADKRRNAEAERDQLLAEKQERNDADLSWKEKHDKVTNEFTQFKESAARTTLQGEFTSKMVAAGMPSKIAKVAIPTDLSEDNMSGKVKDAVKEFAEFIPKADDTKPNTSLSSVQPGNETERPKVESVGAWAKKAAAGKPK